MAFLALFSYLILIRQEEVPSIIEILVIVFVCTLCCEEIRQVRRQDFAVIRSMANSFHCALNNKLSMTKGTYE